MATRKKHRGKRGRRLGGFCHGGLVRERRLPKVDPAFAARVIRHALKIGLDAFHNGSCGPAAIAINAVLLRGRGSYVISSTKAALERGRMSGHVAVEYGDAVYDYQGRCSLRDLHRYVHGEPFVIMSAVPEAAIRRFFPGDPFEAAVKILRRALLDVRKNRCAASVREHRRELAETKKAAPYTDKTIREVKRLWLAGKQRREVAVAAKRATVSRADQRAFERLSTRKAKSR